MHNNQFGSYSFLSPSYIRNQYVHNGDHAGHKRAESPVEDSLVPASSLNISLVSSGYGSFTETPRTSPNEKQPGVTGIDYNRLSPYDYIISSYGDKHSGLNIKKKSEKNTTAEHNTSRQQLRPGSPEAAPSIQGPSPPRSTVSPSGSAKSPSSTASSLTPNSDGKPPKKNARTAYTKEQIQKLLNIFHENPYPDSEYMERIAMDFGVAENRIKIWFQNKRARWRRRVNNNNNNAAVYHQQFMPTMSPMLSPVNQYGYMPQGQFMTSSPFLMPGYVNYTAMQSPGNTGFQDSRENPRPLQTFTNTTPHTQFPPTTLHHQMTSPLSYSRTSPPHLSSSIPNYNGHLSKYSIPS